MIAAVTAAIAALTLGGTTPAGAAGSPFTTHRIKVDPDVTKVSGNPAASTFSCQTRPIDGSAGPRCYSPAEIQKAYGVTPLLNRGKDGSGRTIVIVDAYQNPYIAADLATFSSTFDLPTAQFSAIAPQGVPAFDPTDANQVGWGEETTLDVLWAHAIAPGAKIQLVEAKSNEDADIFAATQYAVQHNLGDVLSQSFGENENCVDPALLGQEHQLFQQASRAGWTLFASSGDSGAAQFTCDNTGAVKVASSPASDPLVTGVGGTTLSAADDGSYLGETAWTETLFGCNPPAVNPADVNCSGGGYSTIYHKPGFQALDVRGSGRGEPDVAYNAGINGGVLTVCSVCNAGVPAVFLFGGTSAGTPQWSALTAIGDQIAHRRLGDINPALYGLSHLPKGINPLHDVTTGNNDVVEIGGAGYDAGRGWDPVTGLGTPKANLLLPALALLG
ncbi:MAG TPA: S53 family peptidase [Nocardioides sp.]|nr:S53 family peptidase [Nocardioides sp.]